MWHKPCRTFNPWCLCIKTRCLFLAQITAQSPVYMYFGWDDETEDSAKIIPVSDFITSLTPSVTQSHRSCDMPCRLDKICRFCKLKDHSVYVPWQWETALQCNAVSHWLGAYTEWSLILCIKYINMSMQMKIPVTSNDIVSLVYNHGNDMNEKTQ